MEAITVQKLIEILNQIEDKNKYVKYYNWEESTSNRPVFECASHAYFDQTEDAFIILS